MKLSSQEINIRGFRLILKDNQYDSFFDKFDCIENDNFRGYGSWVKKHQFQTKEVAEVLRGETLEQTVENIHWFLYHHIQYHTVLPNFEIKTPACAWQNRSVGVDCKTYTTFASSILSNLGVQHYLKSVEYEEGGHIYVVVPIDQDNPKLNPNSVFKKDYFIIDSSLGENQMEKPFLQKNYDLFINPHKKSKIIPVSLALVASIFIISQNKD